MKKNIISDKKMELIYQDYLKLVKSKYFTWQQFADYINKKYDMNFSESAYRKRIQYSENSVRWTSLFEDKDIKEQVINHNILRLEAQKKEILSLKKELNEQKKEYLKNDELLNIISTFVPPSEKDIKEVEIDERNVKSIFTIADVQENGSGWTREMFNYVYWEILDRIEQENLTEIYLIDGGDGIENFLRNSDLSLNKGSLVEQITIYQTELAALIERLSRKVRVNFGIVLSNHTQLRTFGTKVNELRSHDITWLIFKYLQVYLWENKNVNLLQKFAQEPLDLDHLRVSIYGYDFFFAHGHDSIYRPNNPKQTLFNVSQYYSDKNIDYLMYFHYHNCNFNHVVVNKEKNIDKCVIIGGSLDPRMKKSNEQSAGLSSIPCFNRLIVNKDKGITNFEKIYIPKKVWEKY